MDELFLKIVNMSISASWLVLAVLILRLALKKAPKWVNVLLWGIVAVRLVCPVSIESALSLIPSAETISPEIMVDATPEISTGVEAINRVVNPVISASFAPSPEASANPLQIWIPVASVVWIAGMFLMLLYTAVSYWRLHRKVASAIRLRENIFQSEFVDSPFVLGIVKPRIYLPYHMDGQEMAHVIAHEQTHIRRGDHWWKPLGFLLLTVHWFNPLMWAAYILLCRDIELACDEKVIAELGVDARADYSQALLHCSVNRRLIAACPLAFGEVGVRERVKNVLNYKKPGFWVVLIAVVVCIVVAVCFLTDPAEAETFPMDQPLAIRYFLYQNSESGMDYDMIAQFEYRVTRSMELMVLEEQKSEVWANLGKLKEEKLSTQYFDDYFKNEDGWTANSYSPENLRKGCANAWRLDINSEIEGLFYILLETDSGKLYLMCGYEGNTADPENAPKSTMYWVAQLATGEEEPTLVEWFDYYHDGGMVSDGQREIYLNGVTFRWNSGQVEAITENETMLLYTGMPVWSVFFCDLTRDGTPEVCSTVSYGSGIVDTHVIVYDYVEGKEYTLWDRGEYDYALRLENGTLICDKMEYPAGAVVQSGELMLVHAVGGDGVRLEIVEEDKPEYGYASNADTKYYLTIAAENVAEIEVSTPNTSGGCIHADGSLFREGEKVWIDQLDGFTDLRGVTITALDENGDQIFGMSVPEGGDDPVNVVTAGKWYLAPEKADEVEVVETAGNYSGNLEDPPELTIRTSDHSMAAVLGTYMWAYEMPNGEMAMLCTDSAHLLQCQDLLNPLVTGDTAVTLDFSVQPDEILSVRCWPDSEWDNVYATAEYPVVDGNIIELLAGGYIYEVTARWTGEDGRGGTVSYGFYAVCTDDAAPDPLKPEMSFAGLEFEATKVDPEFIVVDENGGSLEYVITYSRASIILEIGLVDTEGNEIVRTIQHGSEAGTFRDIPEGIYHLFVRNVGYVNDLPGETVDGGAIVCQLERN